MSVDVRRGIPLGHSVAEARGVADPVKHAVAVAVAVGAASAVGTALVGEVGVVAADAFASPNVEDVDAPADWLDMEIVALTGVWVWTPTPTGRAVASMELAGDRVFSPLAEEPAGADVTQDDVSESRCAGFRADTNAQGTSRAGVSAANTLAEGNGMML